jgi:GLPGLI family protein
MKKSILLIFLFFYSTFFGQTTLIEYDFRVNIFQPFLFNSKLYFDSKGNKKYTVWYGIAGQVKMGINKNAVIDKRYFEYILYTNPSLNDYFIYDEINRKKVYFKDKKTNIKYTLEKEKRELQGVILSKALTEFRGRKYTLWYDSKSNVKVGPWKFSNVPGLVYEIYDETSTFKWELKSINASEENISQNPLKGNQFIDYIEYPKLKYGLSEQLKEDLKTMPNNKMVEQERTSLEIKFEWEN